MGRGGRHDCGRRYRVDCGAGLEDGGCGAGADHGFPAMSAPSLYNGCLTLISDHSMDSAERAGCWLLHSGIQEASGGVARYHLAEGGRNLPVSNEITGYFASALVDLQ